MNKMCYNGKILLPKDLEISQKTLYSLLVLKKKSLTSTMFSKYGNNTLKPNAPENMLSHMGFYIAER